MRRSDLHVLNTIAAGGQLSLADNTLFIAGSIAVSAYHLYSYPSLSMTLPANATEGDGIVTGTLTLPNALPADQVVSLSSSDGSRVAVPAAVTVPAGQVSISLPLTIVDDSLLNGPEAVTITAAVNGYNGATGTIAVHDNETAALTMGLPASVHEMAGTVSGTITSRRSPSRNIAVQLVSSDTTRLIAPATVMLLAGQTTASFTATLLDDL